MMDYRNAAYNAVGTIDLEYNHPVRGWEPFTANPNDVEQHGRDLYALALQGDVAPYVEPDPVIVIPDRVTSRQFKMQLEIAGLGGSVEAWVGQQAKLVQIAYANSGTFVRNEPMLQAGFAALGFTTEEGDEFFTAAAAL